MMLNKTQKLVSENPFYGLKSLFALYQNGSKYIDNTMLDSAWKEAKGNKQNRELFHTICFNIGDIANRNHNIFGKNKVETGGNSGNVQWLTYLNWLMDNDPEQFIKFLPLIVEYVGLRELTTYQIKTVKNTKNVTGSWGLLATIQKHPKVYSALLDLLVKYVNGNNPFMKIQVAKFCHVPRLSKRQKLNRSTKVVDGKRSLQDRTIEKMKVYDKLVKDLSAKMGWLVEPFETHIAYTGYKNWQKQYNQDLEFVLFSTGKILDFDKEQFINWLNQLPAGGRFAVKRRLFDKNKVAVEKWKDLPKWFTQWSEAKEMLQQEQRTLEQKAKTVGLTEDEKVKLATVKKDAKVTVGGKSLFEYIDQFINGKHNDPLVYQSILDKVVFDVPILPIVDCSGSMSGNPTNIARLITTLALLKNPTEFENLLFAFGSQAIIYTDNSVGTARTNRFMTGESVKVPKIVDRTNTFIENFNTVSKFVNSSMGMTNFSGIPELMKQWVDSSADEVEKQHRIEQINDYQVMLVISDGDMNNSSSAAASFKDFQMKMLQWFGWSGVVVLWDVPRSGSEINKSHYFENIENVIHITTYNASTINQIFTKISDMDVIDIYIALKSLYAGNRYQLVKDNVL